MILFDMFLGLKANLEDNINIAATLQIFYKFKGT
jgi:hypothetical protein